MKRFLLTLYVLLVFSKLLGQFTLAEDILRSGIDASDTIIGWKVGGMIGINITQASFSNWASGGDNAITFNGLTSISAHRRSNKSSLDLQLDVGYGLQRLGKQDKFIKIDDKIEIAAKYGRKFSKHWYYAAFANIRTQFSPGYDYPLEDSVKISDFFAPAYIIGAIGFDYRPGNGFIVFLAPITSRTTIVSSTYLADQGAYGVDPAVWDEDEVTLLNHGKKARHEVGGYIRLGYKKHLDKAKNVMALSKIDLFSNYLTKPENVDIIWELIIIVKINKYISATFNSQFIYDDDIKINIDRDNDGVTDIRGPRLQIKEVMGIGFSFKL